MPFWLFKVLGLNKATWTNTRAAALDNALLPFSFAAKTYVQPAVAPIAIVSGNSWANGNYAEIEAAIGEARYVTGFWFIATEAGTRRLRLDFAVGAAASEVVTAQAYGMISNTETRNCIVTLPFPVPIASGVRTSFRASTDSADATNLQAVYYYVKQSEVT